MKLFPDSTDTIITIVHENYEENVIVNKENFEEVKELIRKAKNYKIFQQGDFGRQHG